MSPDLAPNWCQAARAVVVARGCEAGVFAIGNLSPSGAWLRGALPLAVDERIKVLFHDGGRRTVVTAKVIKHELMPKHVVQIVFEDPHARARDAARSLRATAAAAAAAVAAVADDRPPRPGSATA